MIEELEADRFPRRTAPAGSPVVRWPIAPPGSPRAVISQVQVLSVADRQCHNLAPTPVLVLWSGQCGQHARSVTKEGLYVRH